MFLVAASMNPATAWSTTLREGELDIGTCERKEKKDACRYYCCRKARAARCNIRKRVLRRLCADESSVYLGRGTLPLSELQATKKIPFSKRRPPGALA